MTHIYEIVVEGSGEFPIDMLRYDCCWPATEVDSAKITNAYKKRQITLYHICNNSLWRPAEERWKSFLWEIVHCERL